MTEEHLFEYCDHTTDYWFHHLVKCACLEHTLDDKIENIIHWRGAHWKLDCAFKAALAQIERMQRANQEKLIKQLDSYKY